MAQVQQQQPIIINNFNMGGLADSKWSGIKYSLYKFLGFDPHSAPGILRTAQKMAKDSGVTVTEYCKARLASSNGCTYWGSSTSGKIWEKTSAGVWSLVYTMTAAAGGVNVLSMFEYGDYIYVATESRLHRIIATSVGATAWATNMPAGLNWATFGVTDADFHPMYCPVDVLYIGDGNQVAQVDTNTFSANALDISAPLRVKSLGQMGTDLLIGTYINDNVTQTRMIRWNTWSTSFDVSNPINEVGINSIFQADNFVYAQCGVAGNIYQFDGAVLNLSKKIPGDYSTTKTMTVNPAAVSNLGNEILFGVSNVLGNPCDQGVYRIGRNSVNYPYIMDLPYPLSPRSGSDFVLSNIEIGAVLVVGSDVYASWKRSATVTISIADPGVVTLTAHGLTDGESIVFTTTGALPTGLTAGTVYFARSVTADTLHIYDTSAHAVTGGATGRVVTTGIQSGVHTGAVVGIDKLDYSTKLSGAYFETKVILASARDTFANIAKFLVAYDLLPTSTAIAIQYSKNYAAYADTTEKVDTMHAIVSSDAEGVECTTLQMKVIITASGNTAPEIESASIVPR